jgi:hypothetical protein
MKVEFGNEQLEILEEEDIALISAMRTITKINLPYLLEDLREAKKNGEKEYSHNLHFTYSVGNLTYDFDVDVNFTFTSRWNVTDAVCTLVVYDNWNSSLGDKIALTKGGAMEMIKHFINSNLYGK